MTATTALTNSAVDDHIDAATLTASQRAAVRAHLADPGRPAGQVARIAGCDRQDVLAAYRYLRGDRAIGAYVGSLNYRWRLRWAFARDVVAEWLADPGRVAQLRAGRPVLSRTVEIHPSRGTCTYRCQMCLWSDQRDLTYTTRRLQGDGLLSTAQWCDLLDGFQAGGVRTVVASGGGEALLNRELPTVLARARELGLRVHLYTTGFHLDPHRSELFDEVACLARVRFSVHSPDVRTYDNITGLPARLHALGRVSRNIAALVERRDQLGTDLEVGIGFVAQEANVAEVGEMADFAAGLGVDRLDIRKDEVDVTDALTSAQLGVLRAQVERLRRRAMSGVLDPLEIDLGDELVALANGEAPDRSRTSECLAKYFRPAVSPYGIVGACDLAAEPRFAETHLAVGTVRGTLGDTVAGLADRVVPDACAQCMPSSRTGNAVWHKLLADLDAGVPLDEQPFLPTA